MTRIVIEAEMTQEQLDALVSEIKSVSEMIGIKLTSEELTFEFK